MDGSKQKSATCRLTPTPRLSVCLLKRHIGQKQRRCLPSTKKHINTSTSNMEDKKAYRRNSSKGKTHSNQRRLKQREKKTVQIKRYYNNSAKKEEKFKLNAKYSTKSMQLNEVFK